MPKNLRIPKKSRTFARFFARRYQRVTAKRLKILTFNEISVVRHYVIT